MIRGWVLVLVAAIALGPAAASAHAAWTLDRLALPLRSVSCPAPNFCVATSSSEVGNSGIPPQLQTWDGARWTPVPVTADALERVSCASPIVCTAVGSLGEQELTETWDGSVWTSHLTPKLLLEGISCVSATFCAGAGYLGTATWDGTAWTKRGGGTYTGVSCASATDCVAVGGRVIARWNGARWKRTTLHTPAALEGVSCPAPGRCTAVGTAIKGKLKPLILHFDGARWSPQKSAGKLVMLAAVSCSSTSDCTVAGEWDARGEAATLGVEHWDGRRWTLEHDKTAGHRGLMAGISCSPSGGCMAVGNYSDSGFAEHRS